METMKKVLRVLKNEGINGIVKRVIMLNQKNIMHGLKLILQLNKN